MWNRYFTVLVTTLLSVGNLILNLDTARTRFNHFLSQQISCFFITETGINVSNYRHDVSLEVINFIKYSINVTASGSGFIQLNK